MSFLWVTRQTISDLFLVLHFFDVKLVTSRESSSDTVFIYLDEWKEKKKNTAMSLIKNVLVTPEPDSWINVLITIIERNCKSLLKNIYFWLMISNSMLLAKYLPTNSTEATIDKKMAVKEKKSPLFICTKMRTFSSYKILLTEHCTL